MRIAYKDWNPKEATLNVVRKADEIISEYQDEGYTLTLRQLYYQFVARDIIENSERSYKNLGNVIKNAREAGLISWTAIEDRNRDHHDFYFEEDELTAIETLPYGISFDRWARQDFYVEVWVEKEALGNIVSRACEGLYVPYMACKGYLSASEAWRAGRRFKRKLDEGKECVLIHLGDHDPSGVDMTRDNRERLDIFTEFPHAVEVRRIALNIDQIEEFKPPPNPAKTTDSRATGYIKKFGRISWELDALEPRVLMDLITTEVRQFIHDRDWDEVEQMEQEKRQILINLYHRWDEIKPLLQ